MFIVVYLMIRDWPFGDMLQTGVDVLLLIAAGLTVANYFVKDKK